MLARVEQHRGPSKYNYKTALGRSIVDRVFRNFDPRRSSSDQRFFWSSHSRKFRVVQALASRQQLEAIQIESKDEVAHVYK
jgi:hypothetical protein